MNTSFENDVALVYSTCTKVLLDSQICRGGETGVYKSVSELTHGAMTNIAVADIPVFVTGKDKLVVWGVFYFERQFEEQDLSHWRYRTHVITRTVREFAIAGSLPDLMRLVGEYCLTEPDRRKATTIEE